MKQTKRQNDVGGSFLNAKRRSLKFANQVRIKPDRVLNTGEER